MRRASLRFLALAVCAACASAAAAQTLDLTTVHGNETGCRVAAGGEYSSDDKFLLLSDGYEAHESHCEFVEVLPSRAGANVIKVLCQGEGSFWVQSIIVSPPDPENDSLLVYFDNGELWQEVRPCS